MLVISPLRENVSNEFDDCNDVVGSATYTDSYIETCEGAGTLTRQWSISDGCGNVTTYDQTIEIIDTIPPIITLVDTTAAGGSDIPDCSCVGLNGGVSREYWSNISGSGLDNLYNNSNYPR